jgi:two-component system sensor histidine kinase/response regulator
MKDKSTVLVIDDEESMRDSCSQVLRKDGYHVEEAEDGIIGLEKIKTVKPDLVLVDLKMPGINGIEVLAQVKEIDPTIVAIVITGYANLESAIHAFKQGAYDFLPKPFTPEELRIIIKRGLERRRLILKSIALEQEKESMRKFFITMVSHQLRSPLAAAQQNLEVILGGIAGDVPVKQEKLLRRAKELLGSLLALIKDWLDLAKIEKGKMVKAFESLSPVSLLQETIESLHPLAQKRNVTVTLQSDHADIPEIKGDQQSLRQLFTNLINNAIKFNRQGGQVNVTLQEKENHLEIHVSDTGIGIAREDLPFIFDEFHQVRSDDIEIEPGTGLGLPIARKIAEAHSASITVESTLGEGTIFTVHFPKR